jgi:hypothetical protein
MDVPRSLYEAVCKDHERAAESLASQDAAIEKYQILIAVGYAVLGALAANGADIPERFLDAFADPDSVEKPLDLLPFEMARVTDEKIIDIARDCGHVFEDGAFIWGKESLLDFARRLIAGF